MSDDTEHSAAHDRSCVCWQRRPGCGCYLWDQDCPHFTPPSVIEDARAALIDAADALTADEIHQHPFVALDKIRGLTRELRALLAEHERLTGAYERLLDADFYAQQTGDSAPPTDDRWVCGKCGGSSYEHSLPASTCVWEPRHRPRMVAPDEDPREDTPPTDDEREALAVVESALAFWNNGRGHHDAAWVSRMAFNMADALRRAATVLRRQGPITDVIRRAVGPVVKHAGGSGGVYEFTPNGTPTEFWSYGNAVAYTAAVNEILQLLDPSIDLDVRATTYAGGRSEPRTLEAALKAADGAR